MMIIYSNKKKLFSDLSLVIGCFISCLIVLLKHHKSFFEFILSSKNIFYLLTFLLIFIITIYGCILIIKELLNHEPLIIINEKGFFTRDYGFISWEEIKSFKFLESRGQKIFGIELKDPDKLFLKMKLIKRIWLKLNKFYGAHIYFSNLKFSYTEIHNIHKYHNKFLESNQSLESK